MCIDFVIKQRRDDDQRLGAEAGDVDPRVDLAHLELIGEAVVGFLTEPCGLLRLGPRGDVVAFAESLPPGEVGRAVLVPPRHELAPRAGSSASRNQPP